MRILGAFIYGVPFLLCIWFGKLPLTLFVGLLIILSLLELRNMARLRNINISLTISILFSLFFLSTSPWYWVFFRFITGALLFTSAVRFIISREFDGWIWTVGSTFYIGWTLSHIPAFFTLPDGREWLLFSLPLVFSFDIFSFLVGKALGRRKIAPQVSPGKTWEGFLGGFILTLAFSIPLRLLVRIPVWEALLISGVISILSLTGDLFESLLKRRFGVKDSGKIIPGHGGVLDRIDSLVFSFPFLYYYVVWLG